MLVTATACIAAIRHRLTNIPKTAKQHPAATNSRSPPTPCAPIVRNASAPITAKPTTMASAPTTRRAGNGSFNTTRASIMPPSAAQDGWIMPPWPSGTNK